MTRVNRLWNERRLPEAKELLEKALRNPVFVQDLDEGDKMLCSIIRDDFGLASVEIR